MARALSQRDQVGSIAHSPSMRIRLGIGIFAEEVIGTAVCLVAAICLMITGWQWNDLDRIHAGAWLTAIGLTWLAPLVWRRARIEKEPSPWGYDNGSFECAQRGSASPCSRFSLRFQSAQADNSSHSRAAEAKPA